MPKQTLTVGDIKEIERLLELQQNATDDAAVKDKIDELIKNRTRWRSDRNIDF